MMTDDAGLVPGSPSWLDYWTERFDKIIAGDDGVKGCLIPLEVVDAIVEAAESAQMNRLPIVASNS
jgi:hypothetical protein